MTAILITALFSAAALFAVLALFHTAKRYGPGAMAIRQQLRDVGEWRDVTVTVTEIGVHPAGAAILRPDFKARTKAPVREHVLPAAA